MAFFRSPLLTVLAGILFASTGAVVSAAKAKAEPRPEPARKARP